jgi:flavin reductase (DIM6/NTAB) family NADH-FMN oxidoreductase RutF
MSNKPIKKKLWKPGTMVYPVPVVMVSCGDEPKHYNIITIAWTGNICTEPAQTYISIRPARYSHEIIKRTGEFVINLTTKKLLKATDYCGVKSGRDINKFQKLNLTPTPATFVKAPLIAESPLNIECQVTEIKPLGSHDMFIAKVLGINADQKYLDKNGAFNLAKTEPLCYSHGKYYAQGAELGFYGYSVKKHR